MNVPGRMIHQQLLIARVRGVGVGREINRESSCIEWTGMESEGEENEKSSCPLPSILGHQNQTLQDSNFNNEPTPLPTPPSSRIIDIGPDHRDRRSRLG